MKLFAFCKILFEWLTYCGYIDTNTIYVVTKTSSLHFRLYHQLNSGINFIKKRTKQITIKELTKRLLHASEIHFFMDNGDPDEKVKGVLWFPHFFFWQI